VRVTWPLHSALQGNCAEPPDAAVFTRSPNTIPPQCVLDFNDRSRGFVVQGAAAALWLSNIDITRAVAPDAPPSRFQEAPEATGRRLLVKNRGQTKPPAQPPQQQPAAQQSPAPPVAVTAQSDTASAPTPAAAGSAGAPALSPKDQELAKAPSPAVALGSPNATEPAAAAAAPPPSPPAEPTATGAPAEDIVQEAGVAPPAQATSGGGILAVNAARLYLTNVRVADCRAIDGAGVALWTAWARVSGCLFEMNNAQNWAGVSDSANKESNNRPFPLLR
jgi:hypothetical protein